MDLLTWALVAFLGALVAGSLGFTGVVKGAGTVAKVLAGIALILALILLVTSFLVGRAAS